MKIIKCYEDYTKLCKALKSKQYDLTNDSIGQYNTDEYSVDITLRDYDGNWCIDYDVYKPNGIPNYLDGGKVSGSISAKTSYLINNDVNSTSSKNQKAKSLNIPIISEKQFLSMIR